MRVRAVALLFVLAACDGVFGFDHVPAPPDAAIDAHVEPGCADGTREGFLDERAYQNIAACDGVFAIAGARTPAQAGCVANATGTGCSVGNLCATGWHVCATSAEVMRASPIGCDLGQFAPNTFYLTQQSGPGMAACGLGDDDLFGCGTHGITDVMPDCTPLTVRLGNGCNGDAPWSCGGGTTNTTEALTVTKPGAGIGGALCCRDGI